MGLTAAQAQQANRERAEFPAYAPSRPKHSKDQGSPLRRAHADLRGKQPKIAAVQPGYFSCMPAPELNFDDYYGDAHGGRETQSGFGHGMVAEAARGETFADFYGQHAGRDTESGLGPAMVPRADAAFADFYGDQHTGRNTESFTVGTLPGMRGPAPTEESITSRLKIKPPPHAIQDGSSGTPRGRRDGTLTPKIGGGGGGLRGSPNMPASGRRHYVPFPATMPDEAPVYAAPPQQPMSMYAAPPQPVYVAAPTPPVSLSPRGYAQPAPHENYGRRALCTQAHEDGDVATSLTSYGGGAAAASHQQRGGGAMSGALGGGGSPTHSSVSQLERDARVTALRRELTGTETQMTALHTRALELRDRLAQLGVAVPPSSYSVQQ